MLWNDHLVVIKMHSCEVEELYRTTGRKVHSVEMQIPAAVLYVVNIGNGKGSHCGFGGDSPQIRIG